MRVAIPVLLISLFVTPSGIQDLLNLIPDFITTGLKVASGFIVAVGYAMVINMMGSKYLMPFFFAGFVIAGFTNFNLVAFGVLGIFAAIVYVQLNPKFEPKTAMTNNTSTKSFNNNDDELDD